MDFSLDLSQAQIQRKTYVMSPRPRNLFGHVFMPASTRKKYIYPATPRNFLPKKEKKQLKPLQDDFFRPEQPMYPAIRSPRPVRPTPYEVRRSMEIDPLERINIKAVAREVRQMNKWQQKKENVEVPENIAEIFLAPSYSPSKPSTTI